jgi:hypothetical protein
MIPTSLASPSADTPVHTFPPTKAVAISAVILIAIVVWGAGAAGLLSLSQTSESVALVGMGCLFTILARIVQVFHHHRAPTPLRRVTRDEIRRT